MFYHIVIIGGGPAGVITALTAKSVYPDKSVCVVKQIGDGVIPCAIPYMMYTMSDPAQNAMGNLPLQNAGVDVLVDTALSLDLENRTVKLKEKGDVSFERLVLATGLCPSMPPIPGRDKKGVYAVEKSLSSMTALRGEAHKAKNVVIIGGGFIGAEFADELSRSSHTNVHVAEIMPKIMYTAFDNAFCDEAAEELTAAGVQLHLGSTVQSIDGDGHVESVTLDSGESIAADMVLVGIGGKPDTGLAKDAGLVLVDGGAVWVDDYMRTSAEGVFAVGDCALKRDFFTRRAVPVWLASTATAEARVAGINIYGIRVIRQIQGTIAAFSTKIGNRSFASAGMTCRACEKEGFRYVSATSTAPDRHPGTLPGASALKLKLVFSDRSGILLGGQISGGSSVGELINVIALGIQKRVTVREMEMMQLATHPLLTPAPTVHPLIDASNQVLNKLRAAVH